MLLTRRADLNNPDNSMGKRQELLKQLHTVRDYVRWGTTQFTENRLFFGHGTDNAWDEACALVLHALSIPASMCDHVLDARITDAEKNLVMVLFQTRIKDRIPLAYLTGSANFAGFAFKVDERVIIPRSPIAELVECGFAPWADPQRITRMLDLCTGSGCIGIASALYLPACAVDLLDISEEALAVAQSNIEAHGVANQVSAIQSDLFTALPAGQRYDVIVSNPPYVDKRDFDEMPAEYSHEPVLALTSGDDGLDLAKRILAQANDYLQDDGVLIMEVGNSGEALQAQFPEIPFIWLEFERGGYGVFAITAAELAEHRAKFA